MRNYMINLELPFSLYKTVLFKISPAISLITQHRKIASVLEGHCGHRYI